VTESVEITASDIVGFASQYDPQPFHTDEVAAKASFFGGLAASGWHTAALTMRLMVTSGLRARSTLTEPGYGVERALSLCLRRHLCRRADALICRRCLTLAGGTIGAGGEITWPRATRPGDVLHVETTVLSVTPSRSRPDRGMLVTENLTKTAEGEVVQRFVCKVVVQRRGG